MLTMISRRSFLLRAGAAAAGLSLPASGPRLRAAAPADRFPAATARTLPRWRGFNLLEKFNGRNDRFNETHFAWFAELGFNFVRLPMDYRAWVEPGDWTRFREATLKEIDEAVGLGEKHGIHVCLNFHRAPGYTVANPPEAKPVWSDPEALRVCTLHWTEFARRYRGIASARLSFNLFNEPARIDAPAHRRVIEHLVSAIREVDPNRLVICDGREWGNEPPTELVGLGVAAATRGYRPSGISHFRASWAGDQGTWPVPTYPFQERETLWDRRTLREKCIEPWQKLQAQGVGVMVGEFGAHNKTPHAVVLAWLRDCLELWREAGWGWALWNFRGSFGVLDSGRSDVTYESWRGHKLDRQLLDLLLAN